MFLITVFNVLYTLFWHIYSQKRFSEIVKNTIKIKLSMDVILLIWVIWLFMFMEL